MVSIESIWNDLEELAKEEKKYESECDCTHINLQIDHKQGNEICLDCGAVVSSSLFETCEWNCYKQEDGSLSNASQRADAFVSDNPYSKLGTIPGFANKNSLMMRIHYQQTFSHKQKTFWHISEKFQNYCTQLKIHICVLPIAKDMWHVCMESGKLTRASVRNGLIASCLYYSCIYNNLPTDRQSIINLAEGNQKGFLKGEKIFQEIMEKHPKYRFLGKEKIDIIENDSFIKYINKLELPFKTVEICNKYYIMYKDKLDSVTPKSATAGILFYVIKKNLQLKSPSKSTVSRETGVCIPTINKILTILETV
jgi:transcription initiation factor TFIIIB Brf1 subunit/transcription initiation factor TFIIB|tara:strand:- start:219 stop:1148 length:930 start_codon:yes stop_codon:yes gene_type:complete